jgi:multidrug efflux pump subunit AcrA (membrane-fusion protein)
MSNLVTMLGARGAQNNRPFWTEKSAFIEGSDLYVVGVATKAHTPEEGRKQAFEQGKTELMNFAQITSLEAQGLVIETQMTYEEANPDGTITVFRLLRVPAQKLTEIQGRLQTQSRAHDQALDQARRDLLTLQESLTQKQKELEKQTQSVQGQLSQVTQLQASLSEKQQKIDQQQRQVEQLLQQLSVTPQGKASDLGALKQAEAQLEEREREITALFARIKERVREQSQKACKFVVPGMNPSELRQLLGEPGGRRFPGSYYSEDVWSYGTSEVHFTRQGVVSSVTGCSDR